MKRTKYENCSILHFFKDVHVFKSFHICFSADAQLYDGICTKIQSAVNN